MKHSIPTVQRASARSILALAAVIVIAACSGGNDTTGSSAPDSALAPDYDQMAVQYWRKRPRSKTDTAAPSAPTNVVASAASATQADVSWAAATDNVGVARYRLLRCAGAGCEPVSAIGETRTLQYADQSATPSTTYSYSVTAIDLAGNTSPRSTPLATVTTMAAPVVQPPADTTPPTAPTGLSVGSASTSSLAVSWQTASDDVGVTGYRVYRCAGIGCTPTAQVAAPTGTSYSDTGLTAATIYVYRVAAVDAAGNASALSASAAAATLSATVTTSPTSPTSPSPTGGAEFATRCAAAGVVLCQGFDDASRFGAAVSPATGLYPASDGRIYGSQDTSIKTSGTGALKLSGMAQWANTAGQWVQDIGTTFGQNTTFYVQYRYRLSPEMLRGTGGGRKLAIFHYAFNSCADLEITTQNTYYRGIPQMYTDCGAQNTERTVGGTLYVQQGADPVPTGEGWSCPYGSNYASSTRCGAFRADAWMTLYYRIDIGTWGQANSRIQAWMAYDGEPLKQFINMPNYRINNSGPVFPGIDRITLTPYDTGATSAAGGAVWYDELIVSREPIAAPVGVAGGTTGSTPTADTTAPSVPAGVTAAAATSSSISVGWGASNDNVGVSGYRVYRCAGAGCTPTVQVAAPSSPGYTDSNLTAATDYSYRVAAVDAAGNVSAASAIATARTPSVVTEPAPSSPTAPSAVPATTGWYQVPNSRLQTVCAATNGFAQVAGASGCFGILAWSGGAFDSKRNRLIVTGGGHNDYYGNELYALNLGDLTMTRLNNPGLPLASGCQEAIANGTQPNSRHTYDGIEYMPNVDRLFVFSGSLACGSGNWGQDTWTFDFATMQWQNMRPGGTLPRGEAGMMTAYDPNTGRVYVHDRQHLYAYDFASNTYTRVSSSAVNLGYHLMATIDPKRKLFVIVGYDTSAGGGRVHTYNIGSGTATLSTWSTTGGSGIVGQMYPGLEYDPVRDRVVAWNGGNTVYSLNLDTRAWTTATMTGAPSSPSRAGDGTHGRWRYSPASDVFVLVNEYDQNAYTFRMP